MTRDLTYLYRDILIVGAHIRDSNTVQRGHLPILKIATEEADKMFIVLVTSALTGVVPNLQVYSKSRGRF